MSKRRASAFILYDERKRIALQLRTDDAPRFPGCWAMFGGCIEPGEDPVDCVEREIREEILLPAPELRLIGQYECSDETVWLFMARAIHSEETMRGALAEGKDIRFFSPSELIMMPICEPNRLVIAAAIRELFE